MIEEYIHKLIENLPDYCKNKDKPIHLDLILDGGAFNGSYLIGCLYFLREMEKRNYICVKRISGCSIGSIAAFLYFIDSLDSMGDLYQIFYNDFKNNYNLQKIKNIKEILKDKIPKDICEKVNGRFFITYHHIKKNKKIIRSRFKDTNDLIRCIIRSSFVPFLIDGNFLLDKKYIDGINPYIFERGIDRKILYLDLFGIDKIGNHLNVKNEKTNYHRILHGLLDIHNFFIKQSSTHMCSYVDEWNLFDRFRNSIKTVVERIFVFIVWFIVYSQKYVSPEVFKSPIFKLCKRVFSEFGKTMIEYYCF